MRAAPISDAKFRTIWAAYDGVITRIARHIHVDRRRVQARAEALGLQSAGYLTASQAAPLLGLSVPWVLTLCKRGEIPCVRGFGDIRPRYRVTRQAVEEFKPKILEIGVRPYAVEPGFVTTEELAKRLGYTQRGVQQRCKDGSIRAVKTPRGDLRIPEAEAARIVAEVRERGRIRIRQVERLEPVVKEMVMYPKDFSALLRFYVERSGRSGNQIALDADIDPSALTRSLRGLRSMTRASIDAVAGAMSLRDVDHNRLLVAAGYAPRQCLVLGHDEALESVLSVLSDPRLNETAKERYRQEIVRAAAMVLEPVR